MFRFLKSVQVAVIVMAIIYTSKSYTMAINFYFTEESKKTTQECAGSKKNANVMYEK